MPGKPRSPSAKKPKRSPANQQVRRDIEAAVAKIPSFIAEQSQEERPDVRSGRHTTGSKKVFLWSGVTIVTAVVFTMWFWNVRLAISSATFKQSAEGKIFSSAKNDLQHIFAAADVRLAVQELKEKAKIDATEAATASSLEAGITALISASATSTPATTSSTQTHSLPLFSTPSSTITP